MPKISEYPSASTLSGSERVLLNQGGVTKTAAASALTSGGTSGLAIFNVRDYGAIGDGITDDTAAIQAACDAAAAITLHGGTVYFPNGTYRISSTIQVNDDPDNPGQFRRGVSLRGENMHDTILKWYGSTEFASGGVVIQINGQTEFYSGHFQVQNSGAVGDIVGIWHTGSGAGGTETGQCTWVNITVQHFGIGMLVGNAASGVSGSEIALLHARFFLNDIGLAAYAFNTISINCYMLELVANGVGIDSREGQVVNVYGASCSSQRTVDFWLRATATFHLSGIRSENSYFLTAKGANVVIEGCSIISPKNDDDFLIDCRGNPMNLTIIGSLIAGKIAVTGANALPTVPNSDGVAGVCLIGTGILEGTQPFYKIGTDYPDGADPWGPDALPDYTLEGISYVIVGCPQINSINLVSGRWPTGIGYIGPGDVFLGPQTTQSGALRLAETGLDPTAADLTSGSNAKDRLGLYMKNDKLVFAYNNSGTVTYVSLPLDGSSTTWTHSTTAP